jgi:hypothetical protein
VPTNGDGDFTFSRSTAATRVNASGNIEKESNNQLLHSNSFVTSWTGNNSGITGGFAGYDGTNNASQHNATGGYSYRAQFGTYTGVCTFSIYAKAGTAPFIRLYTSSSPSVYVNFDLVNGTIQVNNAIDSKMVDVGNGWYRCSMTFNATNNNLIYFYCAGANGDVGITTTGDNIYVQHAQVEQGLVARDYIETTTTAIYGGITDNVPRLDYQGSCPALLLEPQRTNLVPHSEYFGAWSPSTGVVVTDNSAESPEGLDNAAYIEFGSASKVVQLGTGLSTGVTCTASIWIKGTSGETIRIAAGGADSSNLTLDGTWQRFEHTATSLNSTFNINTYGGATARNIYVYGAQLEEASYATSYIPTYGSAVTRNKDSVSLYNQDDLFGDGQGTWAIDINLDSRLFYNYSILGSYPNYIGVNVSTTYMDMEIIDNAVLTGQVRYNNSSTGRFKIAIAYDGNSALFYVNGTKVGEDTSVTIPSVNDIFLRNNEANANAFRYNQALLFPTKLTEEELATLTTI